MCEWPIFNGCYDCYVSLSIQIIVITETFTAVSEEEENGRNEEEKGGGVEELYVNISSSLLDLISQIIVGPRVFSTSDSFFSLSFINVSDAQSEVGL